jgi:hypothetical protein
MPRLRSATALLAGMLALAACEGGGGQLAQNQPDVTTTVVGATSTTIPPTTVVSSADIPTTVPAANPTTTSGPPPQPIPTARLRGPQSVAATARALTKAEGGLREPNRDPARLRKLGRSQQLAYRALSAHPEWLSAVLAGVPANLRSIVQANVDAGNALSNLTGTAPPGFPDWTILTPKPAETLRTYYAEAEQTYGVSWAYLAAIHFVESRMGRIHGNSSAGAQGPMQFIPTTWEQFGKGDINDDHDAILGAAHYLQANSAATDIDNALFRYNNDERYVAAIKAYAAAMLADPGAFDGYYQWQVFYATADGTFLLPEGWSAH